MRCLFINPPYVMSGDAVIWPTAAMLPVGPLAVATTLMERGHEVVFEDYVFAGSIPAEIDASRYEVVLLACHTFRNVPTARKLLERLCGQKYVVLGGNVCSELSCREFRLLGLDVDAVVRGYGHGLAEAIEQRATGDLEPRVLERIPCPDLALLGETIREQYLQRSDARYPIVGPGGFGCAWSCNYCTAKMRSPRIPRAEAAIIEEVASARRFGYRELWCIDNIALIDMDQALRFDDLVFDHGLSWLCMTRAETIRGSRGRLGAFRCLTDVALGVEAGQRQVRSLNRGERTDNERVLKTAFARLQDAGISSTAFVMLDLPGSRDEDYWSLVDLLASLEPGNVSWSFYNPPARDAIALGLDPASTGFYRWPLGFASIPDRRVVQHAMVIAGTWWMNWAADAFFDVDQEFGVAFEQGEIAQDNDARSVVGDLWAVWDYRPLVRSRSSGRQLLQLPPT